jgi:ADP-ribosylation factor-binding protein GGA
MSAHPKIQRMCEEESDDHEAVAKLFEINDSINRTVERYKLIKKGDLEGASKIPKGTLGTSGAGVVKGANNELSLIDLGGPEDMEPAMEPASSSNTQQPRTSNALEDDLLGLSIGGDSYGQGGAVAFDLGGTAGASNGTVKSFRMRSDIILTTIPGSFGSQSPPPQHLSNAQITSMFNQPAQQPLVVQPSAFGALSNLSSGSSPRPTSASFSPPQPPRPDPFAALSSHTPRQQSPFQFQQSIQPPAQHQSSNLLGELVPAAQPVPQPASQPAPSDDEWTFASALPPSASNDLTVTNTAINIAWTVSRPPTSPNEIEINSRISNNTASTVTELTFQVAVTKSYQLKLEPQSGRNLAPQQVGGVTQTIRLLGVNVGMGGNVRMRWKASYNIDGARKDEQGEVSALGIA